MLDILNVFTWLGFGNKHKDTQNINALTVNDYYERLKLLALSMFEWNDIPEGFNARFLEKVLYSQGRALFCKDATYGFMSVRCTPSGELNYYEEPISYRAVGNGLNAEYSRDNCVLVRNNYLERPTDNSIILFAHRLATAERTIDVNVNAQKTPVLIRCDEKDQLTMSNIYKKFEGNEPVIVGSKDLNVDGVKVMKTDAPFIADKMQIYKRDIWNEALTFLGINNANTDKKERQIVDEVNANNEAISLNAQSMLLTRQEACDAFNKMFKEHISVRLRTYDEVAEGSEYEGEGETNG